MIRNGKEDDAKKIARIKIDNWRKTYLNIFPDELLKNLEINNEIEKCLRNLKNRNVIVYEKDGKVIAYCYYGIRKDKSYEEYSGEVFALYVKNDCQEHGIGSSLLRKAVNELSKEHKKILLWCAKENYRAISFYKKNGLEIIGEEVENIGGKDVEKVALGVDLAKERTYNLKKSANYIEKENSTAIYANPDLIVLKDEPRKWFNQIIRHEDIANIPQKFVSYLIKKEIIEANT